jgi:hypothetical protein
MQNIDRNPLEQAIRGAISAFADADARCLPHPAVVDAINAELTWEYRVCRARSFLPEDLNAYVCALLAVKAIPRATSNFQRQAVLRLLGVASAEIAKHKCVERCHVRCVPTKRYEL